MCLLSMFILKRRHISDSYTYMKVMMKRIQLHKTALISNMYTLLQCITFLRMRKTQNVLTSLYVWLRSPSREITHIFITLQYFFSHHGNKNSTDQGVPYPVAPGPCESSLMLCRECCGSILPLQPQCTIQSSPYHRGNKAAGVKHRQMCVFVVNDES